MTAKPVSDEPLIPADETARRLGTPLATFYDWRKHHYGPKAYKIRGRLLYRWSEVEAWLQQQREPDPMPVTPIRRGVAASQTAGPSNARGGVPRRTGSNRTA